MTDHDPVSAPSHYRWLPVEVIEITEHLNFCMGNVVKYVLRADHKGNPIEDLKKARYYIDRELARREAVEQDQVEAMVAASNALRAFGSAAAEQVYQKECVAFDRCGRENCWYCA